MNADELALTRAAADEWAGKATTSDLITFIALHAHNTDWVERKLRLRAACREIDRRIPVPAETP